MGFIREFSYPDTFQRRLIYFNSLVAFFVLGFIFSEIILLFKYYFPYHSVLKIASLIFIVSIFTGNLFGKLIFKNSRHFRKIYIIAEMLFIVFSILYFARKIIFPAEPELFLHLFFLSPYLMTITLAILPLLSGIKTDYFLKISCGEFIDDKKGAVPFLMFIMIGLISGIVAQVLIKLYNPLYPFAALIPLIIVPSFLIKLSYHPTPLYARELREDSEKQLKLSEKNKKDSLFFTFLNFTYILIYLFLGHESIIKFYGDIIYIKAAFILVTLLSITFAIAIARISKSAFWFIYTEMLFPIFFLLFLFLLNKYSKGVPFYVGILYFIPASLAFGFSLYHTIESVLSNYDHSMRYNIISISIFILPAPILLAISFIDFTYLWYFVLLYILSLLNILLPGIHLLHRPVRGYKKALYFIFSLIFIPILILIHLYFNIPLNSQLYIENTRGFDEINNINYNAEFIKRKAEVYLYNTKIFYASDSTIRNMKRSLLPLYLFKQNLPGDMLFLDGNQKFFNNKVIGLFEHVSSIDYIPDRAVDFHMRPLTGSQRYAPEKTDILNLLRGREQFSMIADIPNLYDQSLNPFRFSEDYFAIIKKSLLKNGIYAQVIDISRCRVEFFFKTVQNYKNNFKRTLGFLFSNYLVIMGSDDDSSFRLTEENLSRIGALLEKKNELNNLFYSNLHFLSHLLFSDVNDFIVHVSKVDMHPFYYLKAPGKTTSLEDVIDTFLANHSAFLELFGTDKDVSFLRRRTEYGVMNNSKILTLLKMTELAEFKGEYEVENENLITLKRYSEYKADLRDYISRILSFKEEYYYHTALRLERDKKWEAAQRLYHAILTINRDNFEANYRLGILNITLQDLNESFKHLQHAMQLKRDDPRVLYQMGVLLFASGKPQEALNYFTRALNLKERSASLYLYLGLCNEELGRLLEAKKHYQKALLRDPNDNNIVSSIERIENKIEEEKNRWNRPERKNQSDDERGEKIPLPIIKSAINKRLSDEEAESLRKTGKTGQ
jgi:tetratricopeptide (TPR) repeat protein